MRYQPEDLRAVQEIELDIVKEMQRVCEKLGIEYFAIGGTDLGAMRHDGFIPWDDDVDIGMLRDDYERFLELAPVELREGYVLQWYGSEPLVPVYFAKLRKSGTRFVERGKEHLNMHQGIFIDVMPFDEIPLDEKSLVKYRKRARMWRELLIAKTLNKITVTGVPQPKLAFATAFRSGLHFLLKPVSKDWIFRCFDEHLKQFNGLGTGRCSCRGVKAFECDKADLVPTRPHAFEDTTINVPANPEAVLTTQYGNWRKLPPVDKRYNHAPVELSFDSAEAGNAEGQGGAPC